jgi:hypothetical protein
VRGGVASDGIAARNDGKNLNANRRLRELGAVVVTPVKLWRF